ncbi:integrase/recombinase xerD homolog [Ranitomeya imitator]|uniref:integrase/recombinase xerD homolog n=1 Tax=Ranitomeya imitator TaxID=111125 RepID=UPI0037E73F65
MWAAYRSVWCDWESWLVSCGVGNVGDDYVGALLLWLRRGADEGWSASKVERVRSALAFGFQLRGLRDLTKLFVVRQAVKSFRRKAGKGDLRRPISFSLLERVGVKLSEICTSDFEVALFRLAFSLAFFGALRVSEIVSPNTYAQGGLLARDVVLTESGLQFWLRKSKTDQEGRGKRVVLGTVVGSLMCPISCWEAFSCFQPSKDGPLLCHENGSFLSKFQFVAVLRRALGEMGLDASRFASHSFRIGAATEAALGGLAPEVVQRRWESGRYKSYVRP